MKLDETFIKSYLTCGKTRDNFIFEDCPTEMVEMANEFLSVSSVDVKSCCITITDDIVAKLNLTLSRCETEIQKKVVAREFVFSMFMLQLSRFLRDDYTQTIMLRGVQDLLSGDFERVKKYVQSQNCPTAIDLMDMIKKLGKIELNFFILNASNKYLQQAINNFISSREPYSVKIFSTQFLSTYYDQTESRIEWPHDFLTVNISRFLNSKTT
ncbi:MAG: hypothetical protein E7374_00830 [Clostridiales bacterium]|nr:hypothetical protein [Clostridiales bacterium]